MPRACRSLDPVLLESPVERPPRQPDQLRRLDPVPVAARQGREDPLALAGPVDVERRLTPLGLGRRRSEGEALRRADEAGARELEVLDLELGEIAQHPGVEEDVLELADVARPAE